jgi:8-hydroxy-5-deazaflavin:NADPH oxidoreductase
MHIAVIGTGNVGGALAGRWQRTGHEVTFGSRNPADTSVHPADVPVQGIGQAISAADVVVLAVPGQVVATVVEEHGSALDGKVVVDASNRIGQPEVNNRKAVVSAAPTARYVRAFNTLGWENFAEPLNGADLFFAADTDARSVAEELIADVGLRPVYVGDADASGTVDSLLPLWFALVQQRGGTRRLAFRLVEQE